MPNLVAPEIPQTQNPALPFLSAFYASSQINAKRQALEQHLMQMEMQNKMAEQRLFVQEQNYKSLNAYRQAEAIGAVTRANTAQARAEKIGDRLTDASELQTALSGIQAEPGTQQWRVQANVVRSQFPKALATPEGQRIWSQNWNVHAFTANEMVKGHAGVIKDFDQQMKSEKMNPYWLENPDQWVYIDNKGQETTDSKKAVARSLKFTADANNNLMLAPSSTPADKVKVWKTLPTDRFDNLINQHSAYKKVIGDIVTGSQEPDRAAQPIQQPETSVPAAPADPSARKAGQSYQTPKGTFIWDGSQWQTP